MKFQVAVTWHQSGTFHVEAESLQAAIDKVKEDCADDLPDWPSDEDYIDGSMRVDTDRTTELNESDEISD